MVVECSLGKSIRSPITTTLTIGPEAQHIRDNNLDRGYSHCPLRLKIWHKYKSGLVSGWLTLLCPRLPTVADR